jgi:hypothetical protein
MDTALLDNMIERCASKAPNDDIFLLAGVSHEDLCIAFAERVASEYLASRLSFEAADRAMNRLYTFSYVDKDRGMPRLAWEVFDAFDEGEYQHNGDPEDTDPEVKYTKPKIEQIVARVSSRPRA